MITSEEDLSRLEARWTSWVEDRLPGADVLIIPLLSALHALPGCVIPVWSCSSQNVKTVIDQLVTVCNLIKYRTSATQDSTHGNFHSPAGEMASAQGS